MNGELIDYKSVDDLSVVEFKAKKGEAPDKFTVTCINAYKSNNFYYNYIYSYTNISKGSVWYKDYYEKKKSIGAVTGHFDVYINNIPSIRRLNVFQPTSRINQIDDSIINEIDGSKTLKLNDVVILKSNDYIISMYDYEDNLKYMRINPQDGDEIVVDYNDLNDFDSSLKVDLSEMNEISMYTAGYLEENPNYYNIGSYQEFGLSQDWSYYSDSFSVGYLNEFKKFKTEISIDFGDYKYGYYENGSKVTAISFPENPNFEVINESFQNFNFNSNLNYKIKDEVWSYKNYLTEVHWSIYTDAETRPTIGNFPDEVLEKLPYLKVEELDLYLVKLYMKSESYDEWIDITKKTFEDKTDRVKEFVLFPFN